MSVGLHAKHYRSNFPKESMKNLVGEVGEDLACRFLVGKGFVVVERNYLRKWGEIDVIAKKKHVLHFVEVKTVSRENVRNISHETDSYRPEDNLHPWKLKRLSRAIRTYLIDKNLPEEGRWQFDVVTVFLDLKNKVAKVNFLENIIL